MAGIKIYEHTHTGAVRMSDCCLQGIKPCECKGKGYQWVGIQVFRLGSRKELRKEWDLWGRDLQKPFGEFKTVNSILLTKYCSHRTEISTKDIVTGVGSNTISAFDRAFKYAKMWYSSLRCPSLGSAKWDDIMLTSTHAVKQQLAIQCTIRKCW